MTIEGIPGCDARDYQVKAVIPVVIKVTADSGEEAERAAMAQMSGIRLTSLFADVAVEFPTVVEVKVVEDATVSPATAPER